MSCPAHALAASRRMLVKEDVDLIRRLVSRLQEKKDGQLNVYDLGAGSGTSALSVFAEAGRGKARVTTIDNDAEALGWAELAVSNIGRKADWRGFKADVGRYPESELVVRVDLLLVDTDHTYEGTKAVLAAWLSRLSKDGIVWLHDYGDPADFGLYSDPTPGVKQAIDEAVEQGVLEEFAIEGLGWAGTKPYAGRVTIEKEDSEGEEDDSLSKKTPTKRRRSGRKSAEHEHEPIAGQTSPQYEA